MLYLKKINFEDVEEEYKAIKSMPAQENGFENKYHDVTKEEFINEVIPKLLKNSEGLDLPDGYVPDTYFFLWDDDKIVGLFKIRHYLNDFLRKGAGHIGYGILPEYRGKGYAKQGLLLAIEKCKELGIKHIVRGVRNMIDFETERSIADANRILAPEIETIIIPTAQEFAHISSTAVRDIIKHGGDTSKFIPEGVTL